MTPVNENTKTIRDLAAYVCDRLVGKVLIHRYDAYSTNSVYLKFDYGVANSLRIADHAGKEYLSYRFNIILTLTEPKNDLSGRFPRNYYPPDMVDQVIEDILAGVEAKRARYRDYEKTVADAKAKVAHERGFWQQARPVKKKRGKDNDHILACFVQNFIEAGQIDIDDFDVDENLVRPKRHRIIYFPRLLGQGVPRLYRSF